VDQHKAMPPSELAAIVGPYHAMTIRSGSQVTPEVIAAAQNMIVIGRPGVGVDNVDLEAATRRGIIVMNSPLGNMISTAEFTVALLFALARNVPRADASIKAGRWERKALGGVELAGKRIGVVGLGRIGREVAARCRALGMDVFGYDPFIAPATAESIGVRLLPIEELVAQCDFLTLHTTLSPATRNLIGGALLARARPGIRIVNAARGELVDEKALLAALTSGRVAGAALDVHCSEPPVDWKLAQHPNVVATPHIGAQTEEAQERVGTDIAIQIRDLLKGGVIQQAVNFFSFTADVYDRVRPAIDLAERLGRFLGQVSSGAPERIEVGLYGEFREMDVKPLLPAAVAAILKSHVPQGLTVVNACAVAKDRGIQVVESTSSAAIGFANLIAVRLKTSEAEVSVAGTVFGRNHPRLVDVDGVEVDAIPHGHMLLVKNEDTPGVIGHVGTLLGDRRVNIARMNVGRKPGSGRAVMLIEVDGEVPAEVLGAVRAIPGVRDARSVSLG
jgi:D-3-phosphoglycerate dehydrogenase